MALLFVDHLSVSYGDENVVSGVSLSLDAGGILCIVGESGSGKSTLVGAVCGMDKMKVTGGSISYSGKRIGLIPQNPGASFNPIRRFAVQFQETMIGNGLTYDEAKVILALKKVGLFDAEGILKSRPYEMSGGMNQRIAIACAMLLEPELLICDEATSALDVTSAGMVVDELLKLRKENGTAIFLVTHHLGIAKRMADHIGIMKNGSLIEYDKAEELFRNPKNEYTAQLIADVPRLAFRYD